MKFFLDSAKIDEVKYAYKYYGIDGVTTNPNHVKNSGRPLKEIIYQFKEEFDNKNFPISIEIDPHLNDMDEMIQAGKELAKISNNFVVKIPCNNAGIKAAKVLEENGIKTNVTLVFTITQALQAARINATYVSPFVGWKENNGEFALDYVKKIKEIYNLYGYKTQIIGAAIRNGYQIGELAASGIDIVTCGLGVYEDCFYSPYTDMGIKKFSKAWEETVK
ncbi:MAG: fructose-6-phosphate aldolase [Erysipelotrichaceae bacterium]|nr:fructose-6-phosphate aldolase [Erysipelotrichaceae bacterium]